MVARKKPQGQELVDWCKEWDSSNHKEKVALCKRYDLTYDSGKHIRSESVDIAPFQAHFEIATEEDSDGTIVPYPDFKIVPFQQPKIQRDEEDIGIALSDHHVGKLTESYDLKIYKSRMLYLLESVMSIINLHKPIRNAYVFCLGDMVQGENVYQGSKVGDTEVDAWAQIHEHAVPTLAQFLVSLSQGVEHVNVYGVRGNHGKYSREAPENTNWDNFVYKSLESSLANQKNITVHYTDRFYQLVDIRGFRFFLMHGDQVSASNGIPLFALKRKFSMLHAHVNGFNYGYVGHWHSGAHDQINSHADYTVCPPLVTGDEWALAKIGVSSPPEQLCFGVHKKYGRTWQYRLVTDTKFLPTKYGE